MAAPKHVHFVPGQSAPRGSQMHSRGNLRPPSGDPAARQPTLGGRFMSPFTSPTRKIVVSLIATATAALAAGSLGGTATAVSVSGPAPQGHEVSPAVTVN